MNLGEGWPRKEWKGWRVVKEAAVLKGLHAIEEEEESIKDTILFLL